jgi:disulfide oxidoreductase YuzD
MPYLFFRDKLIKIANFAKEGKMFKNIVPITLDKFKNKKLRPIDSFDFAKRTHLSSIMINEFPKAASVYPIVFVEDKTQENDNPEFKPVILLSLEENTNYFISPEGKWESFYIPAIIKRYPFVLARTKDDDKFAICIDEDSHLLSEVEGEALILENGDASPLLERVKKYLGQLHQMAQLTTDFCRVLKDKYLLSPLKMQVREEKTIKNISGTYAVDAKRLNELKDSDFLELRNKNFLYPIYSHMTSISQIDRLVKLRDGRNV